MPTSDPVLTSAGYLLLKAGHYVGQHFDAVLAGVGLTAREFLVLSFAGATDGLSQQDLSTRLGLDPTIVVGLVDGLEERGLLTRTRDPADRRRNVLGVTGAGAAAYDEAVAAAGAAEAAFLDPLSADERDELRRHLRTVMAPRLPWLD